MPDQPHTTLTVLHFRRPAAKWWMFTQMGLAPGKLALTPGLTFGRLLGSGSGNGFSLWPDFSRYAWLGQWESRAAAERFFAEDTWYRRACYFASQTTTYHLQPTMVHGLWGGEQPFPVHAEYDPERPVAVITRATIRTRKLLDFWRYVPRTSRSVYDHPERLLSFGIGEYPVFMQATFSHWTSGKAMQDFAYRSSNHQEVVRLTRQRNWYKEELFSRFTVLEVTEE